MTHSSQQDNLLSMPLAVTTPGRRLSQRHVVIQEVGNPGKLDVIEATVTEPDSGEVRIKVLAAGVAFADILMRRGYYPGAPRPPFSPGYDVVGLVDKAGSEVSSLQEGQMVGALLHQLGGYAQYVTAPAEQFVPVPAGTDPVQALAVILNYLTAYRLLHTTAQAQNGERVLVHSAAGGVGTAVLQLGSEMGLELYGTASESKLDLVAGEGAAPIDYKNEDFAARIHELAPEGLDIVLDSVGGKTTPRSYRLLRPGGRLVSFGYFSGLSEGKTAVMFTFLRLFGYKLWPDRKQAIIYGDTPTHAKNENEWYRHSLATLFDMLADGRIDPIIGATLPLTEAMQAHTMLETGAVRGKIVLLP